MSFRIMKKEVKELLTLTTIIPVVLMAVIFGSIGGLIGSTREEAAQAPVIGLIDEDDGTFSKIASFILSRHAKIVYNGSGVEEGLNKIVKEDGVALLIIPSNFTSNILDSRPGVVEVHWIMRGAGLMDSISPGIVDALIRLINQEISKELIEKNLTVNSSVILNPTTKNEVTIFKGRELEGLSPAAISSMLSSQSLLIPMIVLMLTIMSGSIVIASMGMEKENKTLETLLTLPVRRSSIVTGKIAGSAIVGLLMAVVYMFGFGYYMQSFQSPGINLSDLGLTLGPLDYVLVGMSLFIALLAGLSLFIVLGTFAKNYKSAQTLTVPVTALALFPTFIIMFKDFDTIPILLKIIIFAIPFSHPMMALRSLMFDDYLFVLAGVFYAAAFAAVTIAVAVWIFKTDRIITGGSGIRRRIIWRRKEL